MDGLVKALALSDDLTGAVACAADLRQGGAEARVVTWESLGEAACDVVVVDTNSRLLAANDAAERLEQLLGALGDESRPRIYKRFDSALRGNVGPELAAVARTLELPCVLAPAAPALGVTTVDGLQLLGGRPIAAAVARGPDAPPSSRPADVLPADAVLIRLEVVRSGDLADAVRDALATAAYVVCDAETSGDLERVARAIAAAEQRSDLFVGGSYGLGRAWASAVLDGRREDGTAVLVVSGTVHPATVAQVATLASTGSLLVVAPVTEDGEEAAAAALATGRTVVVASFDPADPAGRREHSTGRAAAELALRLTRRTKPRALILIGGELASFVLREAETRATAILCEPWPATPIVRLEGGLLDGVVAIVKSGAQGDAQWLVHAVSTARVTLR